MNEIVRAPPFRLTPEMKRLTDMLVGEIRAGGDSIDSFIRIDREFPGLTFYEFTKVAILAAALAMEPKGRA
jgi:hypothetical protein